MNHRVLSILLLFASACSSLVPATQPPQLQHTPGAFVTLSETHFDAGIFELDYPSTWRVVKLSSADAGYLKVAFVAPDQSTVTLTQVENADESMVRLGNGVKLVVETNAADAAIASFFDSAEQLIRSIRM